MRSPTSPITTLRFLRSPKPTAPSPLDRRTFRLRTVRRLSAALLVLCVVVGFFADRWVLRPQLDRARRADAIVVFLGPGTNERIARGEELFRDGFAPVLAISQPRADEIGFFWLPQCQVATNGVECFDPVPDSTRGEARWVARTARERGWNTVIVVVTKDQAVRARKMLERCGLRRPVMIGIESPWSRLHQLAYQLPAMGKSIALRAC